MLFASFGHWIPMSPIDVLVTEFLRNKDSLGLFAAISAHFQLPVSYGIPSCS